MKGRKCGVLPFFFESSFHRSCEAWINFAAFHKSKHGNRKGWNIYCQLSSTARSELATSRISGQPCRHAWQQRPGKVSLVCVSTSVICARLRLFHWLMTVRAPRLRPHFHLYRKHFCPKTSYHDDIWSNVFVASSVVTLVWRLLPQTCLLSPQIHSSNRRTRKIGQKQPVMVEDQL